MLIVQTLWRQISYTPTTDTNTQTPTAIGNVFKNIYYENNYKNTNLTEYDKNAPGAYRQYCNTKCNGLLWPALGMKLLD